jgi:hypothetical protein
MSYTPLDPVPNALSTILADASLNLYHARKSAYEDNDIDLIDHIGTLCAEEQAVVSELETDGFELVGIGSARVTLEIDGGGAVVKLPRYGGPEHPLDDGYVQNNYELFVWATADAGMMRNVLLPILDAQSFETPGEDPSWLVMPRVTPLSELDLSEDDIEGHVQTVCSVLVETGLDERLDVMEVAADNLALVDGLPRLFDYGRAEPGAEVEPVFGDEV